MNFEPFRNKLVRKAVAHAIPYKEIFEAAAFVDLVTSEVRLANPVAIVFGDAAL